MGETPNTEDWADWIGRERVQRETIDAVRSHALSTALGLPRSEETLPHLHHWLHFWDVPGPDRIGVDGHPKRGDFLPPIALPRRMWAGGRLTFHAPIRFGQTLERRSTIAAIQPKSGRSGEMVFVTVRHRLSTDDGLAIEEEQDLVFREAAAGPSPKVTAETTQPPEPTWRRSLAVDPVLLFRFSALTMNGHRIHYDHSYATEVEHYPGLVVHGPLQAILMLGDAEARVGRGATGFGFRGLSPADDRVPIDICGEADGETARYWIAQQGRRTMSATVDWTRDGSGDAR